MSDIQKSTSSISKPLLKLQFNNYPKWRPLFENWLQSKALLHHIQCESFEFYRFLLFNPTSITEKRYWKAKGLIVAKVHVVADAGRGVAAYGEDEQDEELLGLEKSNDYKDNFKTFESEKNRDFNRWHNEEMEIRSQLESFVEESIWQDCRCLKTIKNIWDKLKVNTGQETTSLWMARLNSFFCIQMSDNEALTTFISRVVRANNDVIELGDPLLIFQPLQVIAKILSAVPRVQRYWTLLQTIHQMDKATLTLDVVKRIFIEEDKRVELISPLIAAPKLELKPEANVLTDTPKARKCANCPTIIAADIPSYKKFCVTCHKKNLEAKGKPKVSNVLILSTIDANSTP